MAYREMGRKHVGDIVGSWVSRYVMRRKYGVRKLGGGGGGGGFFFFKQKTAYEISA